MSERRRTDPWQAWAHLAGVLEDLPPERQREPALLLVHAAGAVIRVLQGQGEEWRAWHAIEKARQAVLSATAPQPSSLDKLLDALESAPAEPHSTETAPIELDDKTIAAYLSED